MSDDPPMRRPTNVGPSDRALSVESFKVMDVLRRANEIESAGDLEVCHCEVGQPGSGAPRPVVRAAVEALTGGVAAAEGAAAEVGAAAAAIVDWDTPMPSA